ncbi:hypothetical protein [Actinomadura sp. HBU206391]|uniref:hypothetical protein n=1 Tax=Actinomadura sp. HBU206391 TaxID=2731692 RepID=UPI00164F884D|nr:hypothetical protein [Actinomadura sp. HBU206391]MBC6456810.1 hypothetical protein [Actinomadura sp. HBU206391]
MRHRQAVLAALTVPLSLIVALTSCSGSGVGPGDPSPAPPLTLSEAREVLNKYESTNNQANKALDDKLLASAETGAQLDMDTAAYKLRRATKQSFTQFNYAKPAFFIPRLNSHPRWFAVGAASREARTGSRKGTGRQRALEHQHALLFVQDKAGAAWRLAADPYPTGGPIGGVAVDKDGYATSVSAGDQQLALAPSKIAAAHAALLTSGPKSPAAAGIGAGPHTTQAYEALKKATSQFSRVGVGLTSLFAPSTAPVYALRTTDGGALVWYVLQQNERYTAKKPGAISVTGDLVGLAPPGKVNGRLDTTVLVQYLSKVPPKDKGAVQVTGTYRKAVQAAAS